MDTVDSATRSRMMAGIRGKNTKPELAVRSLLHRSGYRFRIHRTDLPGTPDICLPKYRLAIFVHGCFWHRHSGCRLASTPDTNREKWARKFETNVKRDRLTREALHELGWRPLVLWECGIRHFLAELPDFMARSTTADRFPEEWPVRGLPRLSKH
jgi:DNA mismatch endonuclease (patch repair protein)